MNKYVSVIIATYQRPQKLRHCLDTIFTNTLLPKEIIIIHQTGKNEKEKKYIIHKKTIPIIHIFLKEKNKSNALNKGIQEATGPYIAMTDDDCLVDKNWIIEIQKFFIKNPTCFVVTGKTNSCIKSQHTSVICPCTFDKPSHTPIRHMCAHWRSIGFGNNVAFQTSLFLHIGGFQPWLGPGTWSQAAEDGDIFLRALAHGYRIYFNPAMQVIHNKKISSSDWLTQYFRYSRGGMILYTYYALLGYRDCYSMVKESIQTMFYELYATNKKKKLLIRWKYIIYAFGILSISLTMGIWYARTKSFAPQVRAS